MQIRWMFVNRGSSAEQQTGIIDVKAAFFVSSQKTAPESIQKA
jgi:hypothetical protein